jgi:tRNA U34 2-thiouridine synthase MnmA/TrmU
MKALALFSGGLDSTLAIKVILNQGIEVIALYFLTPFSRCDEEGKKLLIKKAKEQLGIKLKIIYLGENYLEILKNPEFGYGKNLNPCIDCKILMLKEAKKLMQVSGASFVITGEVVGQRPKSQHKETLELIEKKAGLERIVLRPLSAKLLPPTIPEANGWVRRENLFDFNGRTRTPQIKLADSLGIKDYAWPAGGCLLTISSFCVRVKDLIEHNELNDSNTRLLQVGRCFRISPSFTLIVGRNEKENKNILDLAEEKDIIFEPKELPGPTGIGRGTFNGNVKMICSRIIARYTVPNGKEVKIAVKNLPQEEETILAESIDEENLKKLMI